MNGGLCPAADRPMGRHDWRLHRSWEETSYAPVPDPAFTTVAIRASGVTIRKDEWYCTRCRTIETTERET